MCFPIFPNETHPNGRAALHTEPAFPFPGCYHWAFADTGVRVVQRAEGWEPNDAVMIPPLDRVEMSDAWDLDHAEAQAVVNRSRVIADDLMGIF